MGNTQANNSQYSNIYLSKTDAGNIYQPKENSNNPYWTNNSPQITIGNNINPGKINLQAASNVNWVIEPTLDAICFRNSSLSQTLASICLTNKGDTYSPLYLDNLINSGKLETTDKTSLSDKIYDIDGVSTNSIVNKKFNFKFQPVTISCWFKINSIDSENKGIIFGNFGLTNPFNLMFNLNRLRFIWISSDGISDITFPYTFDNNVWYNVTIIKISPTSIQFYVNGENKGLNIISSSSGTINLNDYRIGRDARDSLDEGYFKGSIYGLLAFNKVLSDTEVYSIYNYQKTLQNF